MDSARRESLRKAQERFRAKKKEGGKVNVQLYISKSTLDKVKKIRGDEPRLKFQQDQSLAAYLEDIVEEFVYRKSAVSDLQTFLRSTDLLRTEPKKINDIKKRIEQEIKGLMMDEIRCLTLPNDLAYTRGELLDAFYMLEMVIGIEPKINDLKRRVEYEIERLMKDERKDLKLPNDLAYTREEVLEIFSRLEAAIGAEK